MARFNILCGLIALCLFAYIAEAADAAKKPPVADPCELICRNHWRVDVCGESVDKCLKRPFRLFKNYCALRKHNCHNPKDRYRAELDLVKCLPR